MINRRCVLAAMWLVMLTAGRSFAQEDPEIEPVTANANWTPVVDIFDDVRMVLVPPGEFDMGGTKDQTAIIGDLCAPLVPAEQCPENWFMGWRPSYTETIASPFWLDETEVTWAQYDRCVKAGICDPIGDWSYHSYFDDEDQPVTYVNWAQAWRYCAWRGGRLPSELEWEFAARGPDAWLFPWGNDFDGTRLNYCDANCPLEHADKAFEDGYDYVTAPVGSYPAGVSWVGALDMSGNVAEWVNSLAREYPYDERNEDIDILGARLLRGGQYDEMNWQVSALYRQQAFPDIALTGYGFRCARDYVPGE